MDALFCVDVSVWARIDRFLASRRIAKTHPKGGYGVTSLRLLPWLGVWMLTLFALLAGPAMAQTTLGADNEASNTSAEQPPSYSALADLLEDEQARHARPHERHDERLDHPKTSE